MDVKNLMTTARTGKKPCKFSLFEDINLPLKRTFLLCLCGLWRHKTLCFRRKVNIKEGKQHKLMWFTDQEAQTLSRFLA